MFPLILFIGTKSVVVDEGDLGRHVCPVCGVRRRFRLQHARRVPTLFFIPIPVVSFFHRFFATCDHCGHSQPMTVDEVDDLARLGGAAE